MVELWKAEVSRRADSLEPLTSNWRWLKSAMQVTVGTGAKLKSLPVANWKEAVFPMPRDDGRR